MDQVQMDPVQMDPVSMDEVSLRPRAWREALRPRCAGYWREALCSVQRGGGELAMPCAVANGARRAIKQVRGC